MENELEELKQWQEKQKKRLNKGLEIRRKKLAKQQRQMVKKKNGQVGLVRFVDFQWEAIERIDGKYRAIGKRHDRGLQIENRIYLVDGHYKMVNNRNVKITKKYNGIPDWATTALKDKYASKLEQFANASISGGAAEPGADQR